METRIVRACSDGTSIDDRAIKIAVELLSAGELVAFPTETVYGLGANALDIAAVKRIYDVKGRPANNPLIVHIASIEKAKQLVVNWSAQAQQLAEAFWPGPLTLVLKKAAMVPDIVTAGGDTVALRIPAHPIARALIQTCGFPLAAPSANQSNQLSPTTAEHVSRGLNGIIPMILDGGPCEAGIESTVLNLTSPKPVILRPGVLSANFLSEVLGTKVTQSAPAADRSEAQISPGQLSTHYAPKTPMMLVFRDDMSNVVTELIQQGKRVGIVSLQEPSTSHLPASHYYMAPMSSTPVNYARQLYATLHNLDEQSLDIIICEIPPDTPEWAGIRDRLFRGGQLFSKQ